MTRLPGGGPLAVTFALFAAARVAAYVAGVRFDATPLPSFWQYLDPGLLKMRLLESLWYLHAQPPLFNLLLGLGLKIFGSSFAVAAHCAQIGVGLAITVCLYVLLAVVGLPRWWSASAAVTSLFVVSPAMLLFENWLFYEYLVAALLLAVAVAFAWFERRPSAWRSLLVFGFLAALCYVRASFQLVALLLVLGFMLAVFAGRRRDVLLGAAFPLLLVAGLSVKNLVIVGSPSTSSWTGMNLAQVYQAGFTGGQEQRLQARGVISPISAVPAFQPVQDYAALVHPKPPTGIPALDEETKPTGSSPNYNNVRYVRVSNLYLHDFVRILLREPSVYLRGVWVGMKRAASPSSDYYFFLPNRAKIELWVRGYDAAVLWQPRVRWQDGRPFGTAWGVVAAYVCALLYGAFEAARVLRRRGGSATVALVWLLLAYTTLVMTLGEVAENQRVRFPGDPPATILVCAFAARAIALKSGRGRTRFGPHLARVSADGPERLSSRGSR